MQQHSMIRICYFFFVQILCLSTHTLYRETMSSLFFSFRRSGVELPQILKIYCRKRDTRSINFFFTSCCWYCCCSRPGKNMIDDFSFFQRSNFNWKISCLSLHFSLLFLFALYIKKLYFNFFINLLQFDCIFQMKFVKKNSCCNFRRRTITQKHKTAICI